LTIQRCVNDPNCRLFERRAVRSSLSRNSISACLRSVMSWRKP
jgi:hypothetical protein